MPFDIDQRQVGDVAHSLADEAEAFIRGNGLPRIDPEKHLAYLSSGAVLKLKPISSLRLMRVYNNDAGEPKMPEAPLHEVVYGGTVKRMEPNPADEDYQVLYTAWEAEHETWEARQKERILIYVFSQGVECKVPEEFAIESRILMPDAPDLMVKYDYICSLCGDDEIEFLMEAIIGQSVATDQGVAEANKFFPGNGRPKTD